MGMDVVYNHTAASPVRRKNRCFDRIVPGYHRLEMPGTLASGNVHLLRQHGDRTSHDGKAHERFGAGVGGCYRIDSFIAST